MATAVPLAVCLLLMLGAVLGIAAVDRNALPPVLVTAAVIFCAGAFVAALFSL